MNVEDDEVDQHTLPKQHDEAKQYILEVRTRRLPQDYEGSLR